MRNLAYDLRHDYELGKMREEWKLKFTKPFPPFNWDEYSGFEDYKQCIRRSLELEDPELIDRERLYPFMERMRANLDNTELIKLKNEWELKFNEPFPKFNVLKHKRYPNYIKEIKEHLNSK